MNRIEKYQIRIFSQPENISIIEDEINLFLQRSAIGKELFGRIYLSTIEAVQNAVIHGNKKDPAKEIIITFEKTDTQIILTIKDMGLGFDTQILPDATSSENIDKPNGRGLFIISNFCDKLDFNEIGNEIQITFNLR